MRFIALTFLILLFTNSALTQSLEDNYPQMIDRIITSLQPGKSETVMIRYDEELLTGLPRKLASALTPLTNSVEVYPYGPVDDFGRKLNDTDIYIWLPVRRSVPVQTDQVNALVAWLDAGRGRQIHFHWGDGTRNWDSTHGVHNSVYDSIYLAALDLDYGALDAIQQQAETILRKGEIKVTSPAGTNLTMQIGDRTVTRQNGDASANRMKSAKVRIEREIELPAGAIRVAPIETSVNGILVIGTGTIAGVKVRDLRLTFKEGKVTEVNASGGKEQFESRMKSLNGLNYFREIGIGFNPKLNFPAKYDHVPYYGYGQGVVRLSLGNSIELGGNVDKNGVQWMFFLDTTVSVEGVEIVNNGRLVIQP